MANAVMVTHGSELLEFSIWRAQLFEHEMVIVKLFMCSHKQPVLFNIANRITY
jgi:hypothetical protein